MKISKEQAKIFALCMLDDVREYIAAHRTEYQSYIQTSKRQHPDKRADKILPQRFKER